MNHSYKMSQQRAKLVLFTLVLRHQSLTGNWRSLRNSELSFSSFSKMKNKLKFFTFSILKKISNHDL